MRIKNAEEGQPGGNTPACPLIQLAPSQFLCSNHSFPVVLTATHIGFPYLVVFKKLLLLVVYNTHLYRYINVAFLHLARK